MTLSDAILQKNTPLVLQCLAQGADVNLIDEYGFTPLIEAAIVNDVDLATLLVSHGADVKISDLTGGTALHWAVENQNLSLVEFLLAQGADPNAYTAASESTMVKPVLRHQTELRKLLSQYGGNLPFAQDFINTKSLGHRFELVGQVDIVDAAGKFTEVDLEGFFLEFSLDVIAHSLNDYKQNFAAKHLQSEFEKLDVLIDALTIARELIQYQQYQTNLPAHQKRIQALLRTDPLIIPIAFAGHATTFIRFGRFLAECDRRNVSGFADSLVVYEMEHPEALDLNTLFYLLYERKQKAVLEMELPRRLGLKPLSHFIIRKQISGNCSWANVEACVPLLFWMLGQTNARQFPRVVDAQDPAIQFFHEWQEWDQERELQFCIQSFETASPARKASKAALLGAILFQRCGANHEQDLQRAKRILKVLRTPGYEYVFQNYLKVYDEQLKTKAGENLRKVIEEAQWA